MNEKETTHNNQKELLLATGLKQRTKKITHGKEIQPKRELKLYQKQYDEKLFVIKSSYNFFKILTKLKS